MLGLAAQSLGIMVAEEVTQAPGPDLPHPLGRGVPEHERLDAVAPATAVVAARLAEPLWIQRRSRRRDDVNRRHPLTVVDDGGHAPAGERRRLPLERDEHVLAVAPAGFPQGQRRGSESLRATRQAPDLGAYGRQVALEDPEHRASASRVAPWRVRRVIEVNAHCGDIANRLIPCVRSRRMTGSREPSAHTPLWERRLIRAAKRGDRAAESQLIAVYEPMVRRITAALYLPGGERDDLDQEARVGILQAIRDWEPERRVPFRCFAWLCALREARMAVNAARARKHQPLNGARPLHPLDGEDGPPLQDTIEATGRPDEDPVAKTISRDRLRCVLDRFPSLTDLERGAVVLSASHQTRRQTAAMLGVRELAVDNALQRARRKLAGRHYSRVDRRG